MSALPTKYVPIEFSVLGVAATIIAEMRSNDTVSSLWDRLADNPQGGGQHASLGETHPPLRPSGDRVPRGRATTAQV